MKKFILIIFALKLFLTPIFSQPDTIKAVKNLILHFEESIKITSLSNEWKQDRNKWLLDLSKSENLNELKILVSQLELNLNYNSQFADWRSFIRNDWLVKMRDTNDIKEFVKLIVTLETNLLWVCHLETWKNNRIKWINSANKITGEKKNLIKLEDQDQELITGLRKLSQLLIEFEKKIKYNGQVSDWKIKRVEWIKNLDNITEIKILIKTIEILYQSFNSSALANKWDTEKRNLWLNSLKNADKIDKIALLIIELERALKWEIHYPAWWNEREKWIQELSTISKIRIISVKFDTTTPQIEQNLSNAIGFLINLEDSIDRKYFSPKWKNLRNIWIKNIVDSNNFLDIKNSLISFSENIIETAFISDWNNKKIEWKKSVNEANNFNTLVKVISVFECSILSFAHLSEWENSRKSWYQALYTSAGLQEQIPNKIVKQSSEQTPSQISTIKLNEKNIKQLVNIILELEREIFYDSKDKLWRVEWLKSVFAAQKVNDFGKIVFNLEAKVPYRAQIQNWRELRNVWKEITQKTSDLNQLIDNLIQFERSVLWSGHTSHWREKRNSWFKQINALTGRNSILSKLIQEQEVSTLDEVFPVFIELLLDLETTVKPDCFDQNWVKLRGNWINAVVRSSSFNELGENINKFNAALKLDFMSTTWKNTKQNWQKIILTSNNKIEIAKALITLEQNLKWQIHNQEWSKKRSKWYEKINKIIGTNIFPDKNITASLNESEQIKKLSILILDFEQGLQKSALHHNWDSNRGKWIMQLFNSRSYQYTGSRIIDLFNSIIKNNFSNKWKQFEQQWINNLSNSSNSNKLAEFLATLERSIKWTGHNLSWRNNRAKWFKKINSMRGNNQNINKM